MKKFFLLMFIMGTFVSVILATESIQVKGTGFEYLIPDMEQDVYIFPDKLASQTGRYVEYQSTNTSSFSVVPFKGNFKFRSDLTYELGDYQKDRTDVMQLSKHRYVSSNNFSAFRLGKFKMGILAGVNYINSKQLQYPYKGDGYDEFSDIYEKDVVYNFGVSCRIGNQMSASLLYTYQDDNNTYYRDSLHEYSSSSQSTYTDKSNSNSALSGNSYSYRFSLMKDFDSDLISRFFSSFLYSMNETDSHSKQIIEHNQFDSTLVYQDISGDLSDDSMDEEKYNCSFGLSFSKKYDKFKILSAIRSDTHYEKNNTDLSESEFSYYYHEDESSTSDSTDSKYSISDKSYGETLTLPIGIVYSPNKWVRVFASFDNSLDYTRGQNDTKNLDLWKSTTSKRINVTFYPLENLVVGIDKLDISTIKYWEFRIKYYF